MIKLLKELLEFIKLSWDIFFMSAQRRGPLSAKARYYLDRAKSELCQWGN